MNKTLYYILIFISVFIISLLILSFLGMFILFTFGMKITIFNLIGFFVALFGLIIIFVVFLKILSYLINTKSKDVEDYREENKTTNKEYDEDYLVHNGKRYK